MQEGDSYLWHIERHAVHFHCPFPSCPSPSTRKLSTKTGSNAHPFCRVEKLRKHIETVHSAEAMKEIESVFGERLTYRYGVFNTEVESRHLS